MEAAKAVVRASEGLSPLYVVSVQALEFSQKHEKLPSCILARGEGSSAKIGGLYHGGFKAVMNTDFLRKEGVTHIVNTAKGLEIFGPKYRVSFGLIR